MSNESNDDNKENNHPCSFLSNEIILTNYKLYIDKVLGQGSFGSIFKGENIDNNQQVAIKVESILNPLPQLEYEYKLIKYLTDCNSLGIPIVYDFQTVGNFNFMIMESLGESIDKLISPNITKKCLCLIAEQMISRVEFVHSKGIIHRDIKPENFLIGNNKLNSHIIYLIDYGFSRRYLLKDSCHIPYIENKDFVGTVKYASINTHRGLEQSRRDDLESLIYSILYLSQGNLPWDGVQCKTKKEKYFQIMELKKKTLQTILSTEETSLISDYKEIISYINTLSFTDQPDYKKIKEIIIKIASSSQIEFDYEYDWIKQRKLSETKPQTIKIIFGNNKFLHK